MVRQLQGEIISSPSSLEKRGQQFDEKGVRPTTNTTTSIRDGDREHFLLPSRPIIWVVRGVGRLRDEHNLAGRVVLEEPRVDSLNALGIPPSELAQGRCARHMLKLVIFEDTEGHGWLSRRGLMGLAGKGSYGLCREGIRLINIKLWSGHACPPKKLSERSGCNDLTE